MHTQTQADAVTQARQLGRMHGHDGSVPYGDLDDAGSGQLMDALGETGETTDANFGARMAMLEAYIEGWETGAARYYPA